MITEGVLIFITSAGRESTCSVSYLLRSRHQNTRNENWYLTTLENRIPAGFVKRRYYRSRLSCRTCCVDIIELPGKFARRTTERPKINSKFRMFSLSLSLSLSRLRQSQIVKRGSLISLPRRRREKARFYHRFNPLRRATLLPLFRMQQHSHMSSPRGRSNHRPVSFLPAFGDNSIHL